MQPKIDKPSQILTIIIACLIFSAGLASSEETYEFERMWPTLQQTWYFTNPRDVAIDKKGFVYEGNVANIHIRAESDTSGQLLAQGDEFWHKGDFAHAVRSWDQAVTSSDLKEDSYLNTLIYQINTYQSIGHYKKARSLIREALSAVGKSDDSYGKALIFNIAGDISLSLGNRTEAEEYLEKGEREARLAKRPDVLASVLNNMGNLLAADGDYQGADAAYRKCLDITDQSAGNDLKTYLRELRPKVLMNMAHLGLMRKKVAGIASLLNRAMRQIRNLPDSYHKASGLISLGILCRKTRKAHPPSEKRLTNIAHQAFHEAERIAQDLNNTRLLSYVCGHSGSLYEEKSEHSQAIRLTRRAVFFAQQGNHPDILYRWQWQLGRLFRASGDIGRSLKSYHNAVSTLKPVRKEFFTGYRRKRMFYENVRPVYLELAELLLAQAEKVHDDTSRETNLEEAMKVMELLKIAELEDYFEDECTTKKSDRTLKPEDIPSHTAVIYPILFPDHLSLLLILPDGMRHVRVPVDSEKFRRDAERFRDRLQKFSKMSRILHYAKPLYDGLIRPAEAELTARKIDTLIFAPDGVLRLIPFSALHDGRHFLIEKYAVVTVPSVTLTDSRPVRLENARALLNGLSHGRTEAGRNFSSLPAIREELGSIQTLMDAKTLIDKEYTTENLRNEFRNHAYSVLHIATHGVFGGSPDKTFLLTYNSRLTMDDLGELIDIGRFREKPVELLTLSACQTAQGDERAALGLAGVALRAGVKSAVATLWFVDDKAASLTIREFYRQMMTPSISKAKALQNAQKNAYRERGLPASIILGAVFADWELAVICQTVHAFPLQMESVNGWSQPKMKLSFPCFHQTPKN